MKAFNHLIQFYAPTRGSDDWGDPLPKTFVFDAFADCRVRSGNESASYGVVITSIVITVQTYYDTRVASNQTIKWDGLEYQIAHIKPDAAKQYMIVTAERKG